MLVLSGKGSLVQAWTLRRDFMKSGDVVTCTSSVGCSKTGCATHQQYSASFNTNMENNHMPHLMQRLHYTIQIRANMN
jgi:hypothetical protein